MYIKIFCLKNKMRDIDYINFSNFMKSEIWKIDQNKHFNSEDEKLFRGYHEKIKKNQITGNQAIEDYFILQNNKHRRKSKKHCGNLPGYLFLCFCIPCSIIFSIGFGRSL